MELRNNASFDNSSNDAKLEIISRLNTDVINKFAMSSRQNFILFKPNFRSELINKFISCVVNGEQEKVDNILKISPELLIERITFQDRSGRIFSKKTAFEYILWGLDTYYMARMMLDCLPKNEAGFKILCHLYSQYQYIDKLGIKYCLYEETIHETHFDFSPLIDTMQSYLNTNNIYMRRYLYHLIGMHQCYVPAHVMQHYFNPDNVFTAICDFRTNKFKRTLEFNFNGNPMVWSGINGSDTDTLGKHFAIIKGGADIDANMMEIYNKKVGRGVNYESCDDASVQYDTEALKRLNKTRLSDFKSLETVFLNKFEKYDKIMKNNHSLIQ